jgi:outer membrane immunogenic protein
MTFFTFKRCIYLFFALTVILPTQVNASSFYHGYQVSDLNFTNSKGTSNQVTISGKAGMRFNDNVSGEFRLGVGVGDDEIIGSHDSGQVPIQVELRAFYGAYMRVGKQVSHFMYPYAILGYSKLHERRGNTSLDIGSSLSNVDAQVKRASLSGFSYGAGVDINIREYLKLNIEYMSYFDKKTASMSGYSFEIYKRF